MALSAFMCRHHHQHLQNAFIIPDWNSAPVKHEPSSPLAATILLPVPMNLTILGASYKQKFPGFL